MEKIMYFLRHMVKQNGEITEQNRFYVEYKHKSSSNKPLFKLADIEG